MKRTDIINPTIAALLFFGCNSGNDVKVVDAKMSEVHDTANKPPPIPTTASPKPDTIRVSAIALTSAYVANEVKADVDYKGKLVIVSGTVQDIKKGMANDIYVILKSNEKFRAVQCYFNNELEAQELVKGMKVTFMGKCDGLMVNVIILDCALIDQSK